MRGRIAAFRLASLSLISCLAACAADLPWPKPNFSPSAEVAVGGVCPDVSGIYRNRALDAVQCAGIDQLACERLTFYLLSQHVPEAAGVSNYPTPSDDWSALPLLVGVEQPSTDVLRISVGDQPGHLQLVRELHAHEGDFRCTQDEIHLKPRLQSDFIAAGPVWRRHNQDDRALRRDSARNLVLMSTRTYSSYFLGFIGGTVRNEARSVTWPVISKE